MTHVLRYRITAHAAGDIAYDGSAKDYARALNEYEEKLVALRATGSAIVLEDAKPVNVRKKDGPTTTAILSHETLPSGSSPSQQPAQGPDNAGEPLPEFLVAAKRRQAGGEK